LDFYCPSKRLCVEIDGGQHNTTDGKESDAIRSEYLAQQGIHVIRFWNNEVLRNLEGVLQRIVDLVTPPTTS